MDIVIKICQLYVFMFLAVKKDIKILDRVSDIQIVSGELKTALF